MRYSWPVYTYNIAYLDKDGSGFVEPKWPFFNRDEMNAAKEKSISSLRADKLAVGPTQTMYLGKLPFVESLGNFRTIRDGRSNGEIMDHFRNYLKEMSVKYPYPMDWDPNQWAIVEDQYVELRRVK